MKQLVSISLFALLFTLLILPSCRQKGSDVISEENTFVEAVPEAVVTPGFVHAVYFWLKKDNPELLDEFINEALPKLAEVPSIQSVIWGPPAGTPRAVVDNSYDIAWIVNFASAADQDAYQIDSLHLEFVEKYGSLFEKVQIYDNTVTQYHTSK
jgi:hypothetical protein